MDHETLQGVLVSTRSEILLHPFSPLFLFFQFPEKNGLLFFHPFLKLFKGKIKFHLFTHFEKINLHDTKFPLLSTSISQSTLPFFKVLID